MIDEFSKGLENGVKLGESNLIILITRNLLKMNYDIKEISKIMHLTKKEINCIKKGILEN